MVKTSFETLPEEMQMEILARLPLKSLMRCMRISKTWASIIRGEEFRRIHLIQSMTRPRVLFVANHKDYHHQNPVRLEAFFNSFYQEEEPLLSLSGQQQLRTYETPVFKVSQPIRGLICHQGETNKIVICNPGLKKFRTLPQIEVPEGAIMRSFFGYDEVRKVFKVLCVTRLGDGKRSEVSNVYHVCTVRSDKESSYWRPIRCEHDHAPVTEGLFKEGVLYYGALSSNDKSSSDKSSSDKYVVMSFNVTSEEFSVIELPHEVDIDRWKLVKYKGEIALVNNS